MHTIILLALLPLPALGAVVGPEGVDIETEHLRVILSPADGGAIQELRLLATDHDLAGAEGLLQEGFGVGSFYAPNRRLNQQLEVLDNLEGRPVMRYSYDCDGPYIKGLRVTRTMEPLVKEPSIRVTWHVKNEGDEEQWVAPWVRNDVTAGGSFEPRDRVEAPSLAGIAHATTSAFYPASRNWVAVTDPVMKETVCGVFDADQIHSFLTIYDTEQSQTGFQAVFVPQLIRPGDAWETVYRINAVRGLDHVDFATDELAAQIDHDPAGLRVLMAPVKTLPSLVLRASVRAPNQRVWRLPGRRFELNPAAVVRSTYEWASPADGAYDFLAQLQHDGAAVALGEDTGSPHGGIDTQFIIGTPRDVRMEAWTDAVYGLERGSRVFQRRMAHPGDTAIWFEPPLRKVFREDRVEPIGEIDPTVRVGLAGNERESFQLVIRPPKGQDIRDVSITIHDLLHENGRDRIPASDVAPARVAYHQVRVPSHYETPTGRYPDPLLPFAPFTAKGGECSALWLTIYARPGLAAGRYTGLIELDCAGPKEFFVEATVYDFELPATPALKTDFGYWSDDAYDWCKQLGYRRTQNRLDEAYLENAFAHRVTLREAVQMPPESPEYARQLEAYRDGLDGLIRRGATAIAVPVTLLDVPEQLALANEFVRENGLERRAFCPIADMPLRPSWPRLFETMQQWGSAAPDIPLMVTTFGLNPFVPDMLGIWSVHLPVMDTVSNLKVLERVKEGGEVWWFVNHEPGRPYGNFFIDFAGIEHRILFWQTWALGIRGFHYRGINISQPGRSPYESQLDITPANGDGFLVYPGEDGPVNSVRWEIIRDGIEDYDYLVLFQERLRALERTSANESLVRRAKEVGNLNELVPDLVSFPRDPEVLLRKREEIAAMIVELGKAGVR